MFHIICPIIVLLGFKLRFRQYPKYFPMTYLSHDLYIKKVFFTFYLHYICYGIT